MKLIHTTKSGVTEALPRLADVEADVQSLTEAWPTRSAGSSSPA
ncbi:hypothetical protein ACFVGN_41775 [Streptomyces sp. NPDC057757]